MLTEKVIKMASQLIMLIFLARYLGPEKMGSLMYCFALASIFIFFNNLGLDTILVKRFVERPRKRHSYLKHALLARICSSFLCVFLVNVAGFWLVEDENRILLLVISLYHIFMPFSLFECFFQAEGRGDLSALGLICGHVAGFIFRLFCLYFGGDLIWLGVAYIIEMFVMAISFVIIGRKKRLNITGEISPDRLKVLLMEAFPLMLSSAVVLLYMKIDQLMLSNMKGVTEVGIYVAATRLSEAWYFIGLTLIGVYFPKVLQILKEKGVSSYNNEIIRLGRWLIWFGILLAILTVFISSWLIVLLYGEAFSRSASVLVVTIWAVPFVYLGAISTRMYVAAGLTRMVLWRSCCGLLLNLVLNYLLIPKYGVDGAAISSLVAHMMTSYISNVFVVQGRTIFKVQTKMFSPLKLIKNN